MTGTCDIVRIRRERKMGVRETAGKVWRND